VLCCAVLWVSWHVLVLFARAMKREMEQIEKGEMDAQLPAMWEEIQA